MKKRYKIMFFIATLMFMITIKDYSVIEAEEILKVKIGKVLDLGIKGATYKSSDENIAYVSSTGRVTGKKKGTAVVAIKKGDKVTKKKITVVANGKKKAITVCADEINLKSFDVTVTESKKEENTVVEENNITENQENIEIPENQEMTENIEGTEITEKPEITENTQKTYKLVATIENSSKNTVKNVILEGEIFGEKVSLDFGSLKAGKEKTVIKEGTVKEGTVIENTEEFKATRILVYSNGMVSKYTYETDVLIFDYGTKDTKAPVIKGFVGENSYNVAGNKEKIPYQIVYEGEKHDYLKFVTVEDDRDGKVTVTVDTSKVNFKKKGLYTITYIAEDKAGNVAKATAKLGVRLASSTVDTYAKIILSDIIKDSWSDEKKARAIYRYIRKNMSYTGSSNHSSWENEAKKGLLNGTGDCFTYYAVSRILLTRAGIPNIEVRRVQGRGNHWWSLVYVNDEFYHFDTTPRRLGGNFCLVTDSQLKKYSKANGNSHIWAYDKKPKSSKKIISSVN